MRECVARSNPWYQGANFIFDPNIMELKISTGDGYSNDTAAQLCIRQEGIWHYEIIGTSYDPAGKGSILL